MPSGLSLFESKFVGEDGTRGIISGPHSSFAKVENHFENQHVKVYNNSRILGIHLSSPFNQGLSLLGFKDYGDLLNDKYIGDQSYHGKISKSIKAHEAAEEAGTICNYRCIDCRGCPKCKQGERIESISLREEYEQELINQSVKVDIDKCESVAVLPIVESFPEKVLEPNGKECLQLFKSLMKQ